MKEQDYSNHRRYVTGFHFVLLALLLLLLIGSVYFLIKSYIHGTERIAATVVFIGVLNIALLYVYTRQFPVRVQDRAIRSEENLRHFILTGKLLDPRLTLRQIVALRFASDLELPELAIRAASENMSNDAIKKAIKDWRPDLERA